tara:strand:+ start:578 stop:760 length:183 start_codon:yes stop_codon:yes gene_type:complete
MRSNADRKMGSDRKQPDAPKPLFGKDFSGLDDFSIKWRSEKDAFQTQRAKEQHLGGAGGC